MTQTNDHVLSFLGLAAKAGKAVSGFQACEDAIKHKKAYLVLLSADIAPSTQKDYMLAAGARNIPCYLLDTDLLGARIGRPERKSVCIIGKEFSDIIIKELNLLNNFGGVEQE